MLLLFFPTEALGKGFFSLHATLAFAFLTLAAVIRPAGLPLAAAIAAAALTGLYALAAHGGRAGRARPILAAGAVAGGWAMARVALVAPRPFGDGWTVAGAALAAARALLLGAAVVAAPGREGLSALLSLERDALFFLFRILWGIVGPIALSYFIWKTADMKSNQAATGLLYVALVFVLIGELLSSYLTVATGFPA